MSRPRGKTFDTLLELQSAATLTSSQTGEVGGSAVILDLHTGGVVGFNLTGEDSVAAMFAHMVIDVTAIKVSAGNELYSIVFEGSDDAAFASGIHQLGMLQLGDQSAIVGGSDVDSAVGRFVVPVSNLLAQQPYQHVRANVIIAGTSPSITVAVFLGKNDS